MTLLWDLFKLPQLLGFAPYAFGDPGSNLTTFYMLSHGYRPAIDFGYPYGLLGILANQAWFHAVPLGPVGYQAFSVMCQIFVVCAMARIAGVLAFRPTQVIFLFVAIGRAVMPTYFTFAHGMEAVLISSAAVEQARGARGNALALTTAAVFAKPTMGLRLFGAAIDVDGPRPLSASNLGTSSMARTDKAGGAGWAIAIRISRTYVWTCPFMADRSSDQRNEQL